MATHQQNQSQNRPQVLLLREPLGFAVFGEQSFASNKFQFVKAYESTLPLQQFLSTRAQNVDAIFASAGAPITAEILHLLPQVRLVVTTSVGLDHIDVAECQRCGVVVANGGNIFSEDAADMAVGMLIDVLRKITTANRYIRHHLWPTNGEYPLGSKLGDKRVGIVGLGSIGCSIGYNSRKKKPSFPYSFYYVCELAANSDVLIICCALTPQTHHMIDKEVLLALGKKDVIINVGRGAIVDEKEMVRCLLQGEIGGAGLDVFKNEANVPRELFALDNVVLSPHKSVHTPESYKSVCELAIRNLEAFFSNKPLLSPVKDD